MRVIHVLRKPLSEGTVAANVLKHGCGGLNIDASRIAGEPWTWGTQTDIRGGGYGSKRPGDGDVFATNVQSDPKGRWPANLILQHLDGCRCDGIKKAGSGLFVAHDAVVRTSTMMDPDKGWNGNSLNNSKKNAPNSYGKETVANWICADGCPVAALDGQSGVSTSTGGGMNRSGAGNLVYGKQSGHPKVAEVGHGDTGGASRFFKQIGGAE